MAQEKPSAALLGAKYNKRLNIILRCVIIPDNSCVNPGEVRRVPVARTEVKRLSLSTHWDTLIFLCMREEFLENSSKRFSCDRLRIYQII